MDQQDPRLNLSDSKAAETPTLEEVRRRSIQDRAVGETRQPFARGLTYWLTWPATDPEAIPEWPNAARDAKLRDWWWRIPLLSAVVTTFVSRISTLPLKVEADDEDAAAYWRWVLTNADFGRGWKTCIAKFTLDLLTQDNGGFLEVVRPAKVRGAKGLMPVHRLGPNTYAVRTPSGDYVKLGKLSSKAVTDDPWDTPIGVAHLDAGKCSRQLDPETPVVYNSRKGSRPLKFYQVFDASWMTSSREDDANYGMCPVTLCQIAARIAKNIDTYVDEKVGGRYFKRIIWATNVFQENLEQAIADAEAQADARGQTRYVRNIVVGAADVTSPGEVGTLDLSGLPDGFDRETEYDIAADLVTGCFGLDRPEVIPMRTATLGQAGQVGVMALKAKGKGVAEVIALVERFLANWMLPQDGSVRVSLDFKDDEEDARRAVVQKDKAQTVVSICGTPTAEGTPPYTQAEVRALHEYYELIPEKMLEPGEAEATPAVEEEGGEKAAKPEGEGHWVTIRGRPVFIRGPKEPKIGVPGKAPKGPDTTSRKAEDFLCEGLNIVTPRQAVDSDRMKAKEEIVASLSAESDVSPRDTNDFVAQWAHSSNNFDARSLSIQKDAAEEFGVKVSEFSKERLEKVMADREENIRFAMDTYKISRNQAELEVDVNPKYKPLLESGAQKKLLRTMYNQTQERLGSANFSPDDTIRLRRGVRLPELAAGDWKDGSIISIVGNTLESWTTDEYKATEFALGSKRGEVGITLEMDIPVGSIISTARTGFGCLTESEFVVLGSKGKALVIGIERGVR